MKETKIDIRKFKALVLQQMDNEEPLYKYIAAKPDFIGKEEAPYFAATVVNLINQSELNGFKAS